MKCTVEWVNEAQHKTWARLPSKKFMWSQQHERYIKRYMNRANATFVLRPHKDTMVVGVFTSAAPKSYRRYIILKSWLADPYLGRIDKDKMDAEGAGPLLEALVKDLSDRPVALKVFPDPDQPGTS